MYKIICIILSTHFLFGAIALLQSNFDFIVQLPQMYNHCKSTEDKDMNFFDFITDHLINLDCIFDKHENGDHQKPHQPFNFHFQNLIQLFISYSFTLIKINVSIKKKLTFVVKNLYQSPFLGSVFHPPTH
jgi:hypothetical protein